ncbi:TPM domain-containing protein [Glaciibacter psychrotolerans]|uniref:Putative membrane protein YgcG n=1 Tax=Glaciibacter psychrotolerans TaxID=670054 RepID=A0A7Z0EEF1_9MICO|nr:TPM domain-containing protein [Leifsonia psychrotolerans]NYJ20139.1 putative membrane protein YgcG [Leifsonia psychrotolerans]
MRARSLVGAVFLLAALTLAAPTIAHAESPVTFGSSHIVDTVGALGDRNDEVVAAIDTLAAETGTDLFVVYVDSFTGVSDRQEWADQTADKNGLGTNDVLLAVATKSRQYQLSAAPDFRLTDAQLSAVESVAIEPPLRQSDWAGAALGAASGLTESLQGQPVTTPQIIPGDATPSSGGGGGGNVLTIGLIVAVILVAGILFFVLRSKKRGAASRGPAGAGTTAVVPTAQLKQQAGSALVQTDDAVKTSGQELGFAIAQYGDDATAAFQDALTAATATLRQAFTLQQKLDDSVPDTEQQQRDWYAEIAALCAQANAVLDEQAADFDALRQLEKNAPAAAAATASAATAADARLANAEARLSDLASRYTAASIATVADNPVQARERLAFAANALDEANSRLAAGDTASAAVGIRAAEESVAQARLLLDAIDRLGDDLQQAASTVTAALADLETDLVTARSVPVTDGASASLPGVIAQTEQTVATATARLEAGPINPIELVQLLDAANTPMDAALQGVRDAAAQLQRAQAALSQTLLAARSQVSAAEDFITARRGAVGAEARTRLAEAGRLVVQADSLAQSDPPTALAAAQRADSLAADAIRLAQNDVNGFGAGGGLGGLLGGASGSSGSGSGTMGAVLGGILISSLLNGGGGGGGGGMFGGGSRSSGSRSAGSFGGSGTRSRRGGGGRF